VSMNERGCSYAHLATARGDRQSRPAKHALDIHLFYRSQGDFGRICEAAARRSADFVAFRLAAEDRLYIAADGHIYAFTF
jgi:hypothetical protein